MDVGNWVAHGGLKVLLDCLTEPRGKKDYGVGILKDDSVRWVKAVTVQVEPEGEPVTAVTIESAEAGALNNG